MRLLTAVKSIIFAHASWYTPSVLCTKGGMGDSTATATTEDGSKNERLLASSSSKGYNYRRSYIAIIEPRNFVSLTPNGGGISDSNDGLPSSIQGSSTILNGT